MSQLGEVKVPDIGDFKDVPVIEIFVKVGDTIKVDDPIAALEADKATMEVPSTAAGVIKELLIAVGQRSRQSGPPRLFSTRWRRWCRRQWLRRSSRIWVLAAPDSSRGLPARIDAGWCTRSWRGRCQSPVHVGTTTRKSRQAASR